MCREGGRDRADSVRHPTALERGTAEHGAPQAPIIPPRRLVVVSLPAMSGSMAM